jgi:hypothetical protein
MPQMEPRELICIPGKWLLAHLMRSGSTDGYCSRGNTTVTGMIGSGRGEKASVSISSLNGRSEAAYFRLGTFPSHVSRWPNRSLQPRTRRR